MDRFDESNLINWREVAELPAAGSIISYELIGSNFESSIQSQRILFASLRSSTTPLNSFNLAPDELILKIAI